MEKHKVLTAFKRDTAEHQLEIVKNDGLHRHLKFRTPGTNCYHFDIVTWPGYLAITGDMGAAVFSRLPDMLEFFREKPKRHDSAGGLYINPGYWAGKCVANDGEKIEFSEDLFRSLVRQHFDEYMEMQDAGVEGFDSIKEALWSHLESAVLGVDCTRDAINAMTEFEPEGHEGYGDHFADFEFCDAWESANSIECYTFHFIWRLYAIAHAVIAYDAATGGEGIPA